MGPLMKHIFTHDGRKATGVTNDIIDGFILYLDCQ